jgi:hypothetical protein
MKMNLIELERKSIERSSLENISSEFSTKLKEVESFLVQEYEEYIKWMKLTEEQVKEFKDAFQENLCYEKILYPNGQPVLISNAKDGDFEYGYNLTLIEDISINTKMKTKVSMGEIFSTYLFEKEKSEETSYLFLYETIGDSGERTDSIIVVKF